MSQRIQTQIENNQHINQISEEIQIKKDYQNFILIENSISKTIYECIRKQSDQKYIVYQLQTQSFQQNIPHLIQKLNQQRLVNLIHPENIYYEQNCIYMTQQKFLDTFRLQNCRKRLNKQLQLFLVTQLCITLQELNRRSFPPYILSLNNIYIIEGVLHLSLIHFNFEEIEYNYFESFKQFVNQYFHVNEYCKDNFENTTDNLLSIQKSDYDLGCIKMNFFKKIFQINDLKAQSIGFNSFTYTSSRPSLFQIYPQIKNEIFIKVPRIIDEDDIEVNQYRQIQNERELMFNEQLIDNSKFATFFAYFRIQKIPFFIFLKYPLTLHDLFEESSQKIDHPLKNLQYKFAMQLALALTELHKMQILHRDIKPQNVFLTNLDCHMANLKIADFDRSRKMNQQDCNQDDPNGDYSVFSSTYDFNPPEAFGTKYDFSSDIWQFGLTLFQMANNGIYPPVKTTKVFQDEDYLKINLDFIKQVLQDKQYINQDYVYLISRCLEFNSDQRITLNNFIQHLRKIRIDMNDQDDVLEPDQYEYSEQSTSNLDSTICWKNFTFGESKSPNWNLNELTQSTGDTSIFIQDQ
ncbi:unnamed protein product [Paramecium pentaurelia]|uniref:Protein kinase domain-containing protein n=1 Tax=Paramecium pentaurelia TaxID=43138 RepID=A0A8S1SLM1_9CILI|nr:unnamed protein product [Paramecium pentaurelia]